MKTLINIGGSVLAGLMLAVVLLIIRPSMTSRQIAVAIFAIIGLWELAKHDLVQAVRKKLDPKLEEIDARLPEDYE